MIGFNIQNFMSGEAAPNYNNNKLFILFGESNSGGYAQNSLLTLTEAAPRNLKILNNNTLLFEKLLIGTNNTIGHYQLDSSTGHSFENELANKYDAGYWGSKTVYIVKSGQGGSRIEQWDAGGNYYNLFLTRVRSAISQLFSGFDPNIEIMLSLGINDANNNTPDEIFKTNYKSLIQRIRIDLNLPKLRFSLMLFDFNNYTHAYKDPYILEVASELSYVTVFDTQGCTVLPDGAHLDYLGMKKACNNFLAVI